MPIDKSISGLPNSVASQSRIRLRVRVPLEIKFCTLQTHSFARGHLPLLHDWLLTLPTSTTSSFLSPFLASCLRLAMASALARMLAAIARPSSTHPIHTIVFIGILASTAYLSILNISVPNSESQLLPAHLYRPSTISEWKQIDDPDKYASAEHYALLQLRFQTDVAGVPLPFVNSSVPAISPQGRDVLVKFNSLRDWTEIMHDLQPSYDSDSAPESAWVWHLASSRRGFVWIEWLKFSYSRFVQQFKVCYRSCLTAIFY